MRGLWHRLRWLLVPLLMLLGYFLFWPTGLDPYAWTPKPTPGTSGNSPFKPTQGLDGARPLAESLITDHFAAAGKPNNFGPEDVAVSPLDGHVYTGLGDGSLLRIDPDTGAASIFTNTGGRPLGVTFSASGDRLYVADGHLGLLSVDTNGKVTVLVSNVAGEPVTFADNLDVAPDGKVWFSAPTREHTLEQVELDVWDSRPTGRLLRFDPGTGRADKVLDNLFYANGVAVSQDGSFVLVAEFLAFRIQRYWIAGPRAGSHEVFARQGAAEAVDGQDDPPPAAVDDAEAPVPGLPARVHARGQDPALRRRRAAGPGTADHGRYCPERVGRRARRRGRGQPPRAVRAARAARCRE